MKTLAIIYTNLDSSKLKSYANNLDRFSLKIFNKHVIDYVKEALLANGLTVILDSDYNSKLLDNYENVIVVYGCIPTIKKESIEQLLSYHTIKNNDVTFQKGIYVINKNTFAENEFLKDIDLAVNECCKNVESVSLIKDDELIEIDDRIKLSLAFKIIQQRINEFHMLNGVTIVNPSNTYIDSDVKIGNDTIVYPNTYICKKSVIGVGCELGPNAYITNSYVDNRMVLKNCSIENKILKTN